MYKCQHIPVLLEEVINSLNVKHDGIYVDCTAGTGGHALQIVKRLCNGGNLILIDRDPMAIETCKLKLRNYAEKVITVIDCFSNIQNILMANGIMKVNGVLLDLGISLPQLKESKRGFSFQLNEPLDMRMGNDTEKKAIDLVNTLPEYELERILLELGEEKKAKAIAKAIVAERQKGKIETTAQLADIACAVVRSKKRKIHPATKTFMALRIHVNDELNELKRFLSAIPSFIEKFGRLVVISYHSLEDRIVKHYFRSNIYSDFIILTKKPIVASAQEVKQNPSARSAKMRVVERR